MNIPMFRFAAAGVVPAGLSMLLYGSGAVAGPPLSIDDPGILEIGEAQVIVAGTVEERDSGTAYYLPILDISCGLSPNVQMSVTATRAVTGPDASESKSDFGPAAIGVKRRFPDRDGLQMAIAPFFETSLRDGAEDRGVIDDVNAWVIPVNLQYEF